MTTLDYQSWKAVDKCVCNFKLCHQQQKLLKKKVTFFFFPYLRRDVTLKQEVQKQMMCLYATDINLYRYNFLEKKECFRSKGWSLKAVIFFNGYLWLHSILWDLCIPALSHPVPQKKTCSAAVKAAYLHLCYYKRHSLSSSTFWVLNTMFFLYSF